MGRQAEARTAVLGMACALAVTLTAWADEAPARSARPTPGAAAPSGGEGRPSVGGASDKLSVTTGRLNPEGGETLRYTATTGYMPLSDEHGKLRANLFYVAYTAAPEGERTGKKRPVTFLFNGGPGAAAVWLHLGAVGPRRLDVPADGAAPKPPYGVVNNEYSWLP